MLSQICLWIHRFLQFSSMVQSKEMVLQSYKLLKLEPQMQTYASVQSLHATFTSKATITWIQAFTNPNLHDLQDPNQTTNQAKALGRVHPRTTCTRGSQKHSFTNLLEACVSLFFVTSILQHIFSITLCSLIGQVSDFSSNVCK